MDSSVSLENQIWFLRVCHQVPFLLYYFAYTANGICDAFMLTGCWQDRIRMTYQLLYIQSSRVKTECGGTRAETRFGPSAKGTSPFISAGVSVQSAAGSRGVRISGSNAGLTVSDTVQDCWLPPPFAFFPFTSPPVRFRVPPDSVSTLPPDDVQ